MKIIIILISLSFGFFANAEVQCNIENYQEFINNVALEDDTDLTDSDITIIKIGPYIIKAFKPKPADSEDPDSEE